MRRGENSRWSGSGGSSENVDMLPEDTTVILEQHQSLYKCILLMLGYTKQNMPTKPILPSWQSRSCSSSKITMTPPVACRRLLIHSKPSPPNFRKSRSRSPSSLARSAFLLVSLILLFSLFPFYLDPDSRATKEGKEGRTADGHADGQRRRSFSKPFSRGRKEGAI